MRSWKPWFAGRVAEKRRPEVAGEPVAYQKRRKWASPLENAGAIQLWEPCTKNESTGYFERDSGCEYRALYAHPDPALVELRAEIDTLRAKGDALAEYTGHADTCQIMTNGVWSDPIPCTCGLHEALSAWKDQNNG